MLARGRQMEMDQHLETGDQPTESTTYFIDKLMLLNVFEFFPCSFHREGPKRLRFSTMEFHYLSLKIYPAALAFSSVLYLALPK